MSCGAGRTKNTGDADEVRIPKIVFSDLDGTLIRYRQPEITREIFDAARKGRA